MVLGFGIEALGQPFSREIQMEGWMVSLVVILGVLVDFGGKFSWRHFEAAGSIDTVIAIIIPSLGEIGLGLNKKFMYKVQTSILLIYTFYSFMIFNIPFK